MKRLELDDMKEIFNKALDDADTTIDVLLKVIYMVYDKGYKDGIKEGYKAERSDKE